MIGTELQRQLREDGHQVFTLVRRQPKNDTEFAWSPESRVLDFRILESVDAVVNLSGASISRIPWTSGWKKQILESRVNATRALAEAMKRGKVVPLTTDELARAAKDVKPSTRAWFESARNHALYANQSGFYDDVLVHLGLKK